MLKLARKICDEYNLQYIINLNYDTYKEIIECAELDKFDDNDFIEYINNRIAIRLYDDKPENKLLGIDFE